MEESGCGGGMKRNGKLVFCRSSQSIQRRFLPHLPELLLWSTTHPVKVKNSNSENELKINPVTQTDTKCCLNIYTIKRNLMGYRAGMKYWTFDGYQLGRLLQFLQSKQGHIIKKFQRDGTILKPKIHRMQKWPPINYSFVFVKISLPSLVLQPKFLQFDTS